jgi:hypothetical protein
LQDSRPASSFLLVLPSATQTARRPASAYICASSQRLPPRRTWESAPLYLDHVMIMIRSKGSAKSCFPRDCGATAKHCHLKELGSARARRVAERASAAIAQLGERQTEDLKVPSSIPGLGIAFGKKASNKNNDATIFTTLRPTCTERCSAANDEREPRHRKGSARLGDFLATHARPRPLGESTALQAHGA